MNSEVFKGLPSIIGYINLGDITSESVIEKSFKIKNGSNENFSISSVKPTCGCVEVKVAAGVYRADKCEDAIGSVRINVPRVAGKNLRLVEIPMFETRESAQPVATLIVIGSVHRPFLVKDSNWSVQLPEDEAFELRTPFYADPVTDVSMLVARCSDASFKVSALRTGNETGEIVLSGIRRQALVAGQISLLLQLECEKKVVKASGRLKTT